MNTAFLCIDIQLSYFPGGAMELARPEEAAREAARLLAYYRERGWTVVHIHHVSGVDKSGVVHPLPRDARIHDLVAPYAGELVIPKGRINSFRDTGLEALLRARKVERLVVAGMMTNMCVEAAVRQAVDLGFEVLVAHDACATRDYAFGGRVVPAADVHAAALAAMAFAYARALSTDELLDLFARESGAGKSAV
jgi:nicotinamidase-related amidase